jgi:TfoX/Sxy family transcriptional regulator of competence genes
MACDEALAERIRGRLRDAVGVREKKMFGGLVFLTDATITVGVYGDDLLVRIDPNDADVALTEPGVRRFTMGGRTTRGFIVVAGDTLNDTVLRRWIGRARAHVAALPPK